MDVVFWAKIVVENCKEKAKDNSFWKVSAFS